MFKVFRLFKDEKNCYIEVKYVNEGFSKKKLQQRVHLTN